MTISPVLQAEIDQRHADFVAPGAERVTFANETQLNGGVVQSRTVDLCLTGLR